ncbi:uncharacterized protein LOC113351776 [Papaver somniferum]|uniref:uncharacterized protein LOC113351776 n=1 Tax=Papaver somniferum TaxID=3469 RepID=UPI000E6F4ACB|nr:uncharacterized protein LOC113351776 [Papaver somniferum]
MVLVGAPAEGPELIDEEQFKKVMIWLLIKRIPYHIILDIQGILRPIGVFQLPRKPMEETDLKRTWSLQTLDHPSPPCPSPPNHFQSLHNNFPTPQPSPPPRTQQQKIVQARKNIIYKPYSDAAVAAEFEIKMKTTKKLELETDIANLASSSKEPLIFSAQPETPLDNFQPHPDVLSCQIKNKKNWNLLRRLLETKKENYPRMKTAARAKTISTSNTKGHHTMDPESIFPTSPPPKPFRFNSLPTLAQIKARMEANQAKKKKETWKAKKKSHVFEQISSPTPLDTMMETKRNKPTQAEDGIEISSFDSDFLKRFKDQDKKSARSLDSNNNSQMANGGASGTAGGLTLIRKSNLNIEILDSSLNHINAIVRPASGSPWLYTGYYGSPYDTDNKLFSWKMLENTAAINNLPWLVIGDLNIILHDTEKFSVHTIDTNEANIFSNKIFELDLVDLGSTGCPFTWSNKRDGHNLTEQRLDRGLSSESWLLLHPNNTIINMLAIGSDHHPILLNSNPSWQTDRKLKDIKLQLRKWNKEIYGNIKINIEECKQHLLWLQTNYFRADKNQAIKVARYQLKDWQDVEEKFWKKKSRDQFTKMGDQNTSYFHRATKCRTRRNKIDAIQDNQGHWITDYKEIKHCFTQHFSRMATAENPPINPEIINLIPTTITSTDNSMLNRIPDHNEVKSILFSMAKDKALGPDGFPPNFFQAN